MIIAILNGFQDLLKNDLDKTCWIFYSMEEKHSNAIETKRR